jgi:hypothetical protein
VSTTSDPGSKKLNAMLLTPNTSSVATALHSIDDATKVNVPNWKV